MTLPQYANKVGIVHEAPPHGTGRAERQTDETFGTLSFERKELDKNRHQIRCQTD